MCVKYSDCHTPVWELSRQGWKSLKQTGELMRQQYRSGCKWKRSASFTSRSPLYHSEHGSSQTRREPHPQQSLPRISWQHFCTFSGVVWRVFQTKTKIRTSRSAAAHLPRQHENREQLADRWASFMTRGDLDTEVNVSETTEPVWELLKPNTHSRAGVCVCVHACVCNSAVLWLYNEDFNG